MSERLLVVGREFSARFHSVSDPQGIGAWAAEMLSPVNWGLQPFKFVRLYGRR